ncbi:helix-turn-helix domain-containing protein [Streptomyces bauhiniae]|uniref:helix-turn-helix domain-containing protein n=1 Tax=Streptomyces bauhiniae TaxID=2340725 RepID=UPI0035E303F9
MPENRPTLPESVDVPLRGAGWLPHGYHLDAHSHPHGQLVYAAAGVLATTTERGTWVAPANRVTRTPPGFAHAHRFYGRTDARILSVPPELCAVRCLDVMRGLGETDRGATTRRYAMCGLVFDPRRAQELEGFVTDSLGPLLDYDRRRSTDLVSTVAAYFAQSGNLSRAAHALHVHTDTLLKRLGDDWRSADSALRLHLAVRLHQLRAMLDGPG